MSNIRKTFMKLDGTTSKIFQIGKNKVTIDNLLTGELKFTLLNDNDEQQEWVLNVNTNTIEFPNGSLINVDSETKDILFSMGRDQIQMGIVQQDDPQFGAIKVYKKVVIDGQEIEEEIKIGVDDTRTHIPEKGVNRKDIPTVWAVWNAIKRVKDIQDAEIASLKYRTSSLEWSISPGSWDEE